MMRKGLMKGSGKPGYYNVVGKDPLVHRQSAMGIKQSQRMGIYGGKFTYRQTAVAFQHPRSNEIRYFVMPNAIHTTDAETIWIQNIRDNLERETGANWEVQPTAQDILVTQTTKGGKDGNYAWSKDLGGKTYDAKVDVNVDGKKYSGNVNVELPANFGGKMTKRDYVKLADMIGKIKDPIERTLTLERYSQIAAEDNPKFDKQRFMAAVDKSAKGGKLSKKDQKEIGYIINSHTKEVEDANRKLTFDYIDYVQKGGKCGGKLIGQTQTAVLFRDETTKDERYVRMPDNPPEYERDWIDNVEIQLYKRTGRIWKAEPSKKDIIVQRATKGGKWADWMKTMSTANPALTKYSNVKLEEGTIKEHIEHPKFTIPQARQIAKDHLRDNPKYYGKRGGKLVNNRFMFLFKDKVNGQYRWYAKPKNVGTSYWIEQMEKNNNYLENAGESGIVTSTTKGGKGQWKRGFRKTGRGLVKAVDWTKEVVKGGKSR